MKKIVKIFICIGFVSILVFHLLPIKAPNIYLNSIDGQKLQIDSFKGSPLLVTFWATTCHICVEEIPNLVKLHEELKLGLNNSQGIDSDNDIISIDDKYL